MSSRKMAETLETILLQINLNADQIKTELVATKDRVADYRVKLKEASAELIELQKNGEKNAVAISNQKEKIVGLNSELQGQVKNQNTLQLALTKTAQANTLEAGSLAQKRAALAAGQIAYAQYSAEQINTDETAKALGVTLGTLKEDILSQAKEMGSTVENVGNYESSFKSLRSEFTAAKNELASVTRQFGENSKEAIIASEKVGKLKDEIKDIGDRVAALTVEGKIETITKVATGLAGGFAAAQGAFALLGFGGENLERLLVNLEAARNVLQGLKEFSKIAGDLKGLSLATQTAATATAAKTVVDGANTVAVNANAAAQGELVVVQQTSIVSTEALAAVMQFALGPIGLIIIGVAALAGVYALLNSQDPKVTIDGITKSAEAETEAHKKTLAALNELSSARLSDAENALKEAEGQGKSGESIIQLQKDVVEAKKAALKSEVEENKSAYAAQLSLQQQAQAEILKGVDEEEGKKLKAVVDGAEKELEAIRTRNGQIQTEANNLNAELDRIALNAEENRLKISEQATTVRISNIKNAREREIAAEKESLNERIRELQKNEEQNGELIYETRLASERAVNAIILKYDKQFIEDRNKLRVLATADGTPQRLEAERQAIIAIRDIDLKEEGLTATQRKVIRAEAQDKLNAIDREALTVKQNLANQEIEIEKQKQDAILAQKKALAQAPTEQFAVELESLNNSLSSELKAIETSNDFKNASTAKFYDQQIELAKGNSSEIQRLTDEKNLAIQNNNEIADAEALAKVLETGQATFDATQKQNDDLVQAQLSYIELKKAALDPTFEYDLNTEKNAILEQQEIDHATASIKNEEQLQQTLDLIRKKYAKIETLAAQTKDQKNLKDASDYLGALSGLFKKNGDEYKVFATARAIIDTYSAATAATSLPPIGLGPIAGIPVAIKAVVSGLANVAAINGVQFFDGGYTEKGNPREVSRFSRNGITVHKGEWIASNKLVSDPVTGPMIAGLEAYQRGSYNPMNGMHGFASGGFVPDFSFVSPNVSAPVFEAAALQNAMVAAVASLPTPVLAYDEFSTFSNGVKLRESRAIS